MRDGRKILAIGVLGALAYWLWRRVRKPKPPPEVPPEAAEEVAEAQAQAAESQAQAEAVAQEAEAQLEEEKKESIKIQVQQADPTVAPPPVPPEAETSDDCWTALTACYRFCVNARDQCVIDAKQKLQAGEISYDEYMDIFYYCTGEYFETCKENCNTMYYECLEKVGAYEQAGGGPATLPEKKKVVPY